MGFVRRLASLPWKRILTAVTASGLFVSVVCFTVPAMRKSSALTAVGEKTVQELAAFSIALSHYSSDDITSLAQAPSPDGAFKDLSGLLARVRLKNDYVSLSLLTRNDALQYFYLADAAYRDNAVANVDYRAPGSPYPLEEYKTARALLDSLYNQRALSRYTTQLITRGDLRQISAAYLPVYGMNNTVIAVVAADCDPGSIGYHLIGPINLYWLGGVGLLAASLSVLTLVLMNRHNKASVKGVMTDGGA